MNQVNLTDIRHIDDHQQIIDLHIDLRFLHGFARCALCAALAKLHEAGRERPQTEARLDVATTHQHPAISVFRNHADDQFRIQILDMSAAAADVAWQMIAVRNAEGGRLPTEMAEADVWKHRGKVAGTVVNYRATCHFMRRPGGRSRLAWSATGRIAQIGRASSRERVCQYVEHSVVAGSFKKKKTRQKHN